MAARPSKTELLQMYRMLLRSAQTYPSKNRQGIYQSIRDEFRANQTLDPTSEKARKEVNLAYQGLGQLRQFDGRRGAANFAVTLEQNPFPKPESADQKRPSISEGIQKLEKEQREMDH